MRHVLAPLAATVLAVPLVTTPMALAATAEATPTARAAAGVGSFCDTRDFVDHDKHLRVIHAAKKPIVLHLRTKAIPPSGSHKVTVKASTRTTVTASVKYGASANVATGLAERIIAKAEASMNVELQASGSRTAATTQTITDVIRNPTRQNATFAFFDGTMRVTALWQHYYCKADHRGSRSGRIVWQTGGRLTNWTVESDGSSVRCGAGTKNLNSIDKAGYAVGCA